MHQKIHSKRKARIVRHYDRRCFTTQRNIKKSIIPMSLIVNLRIETLPNVSIFCVGQHVDLDTASWAGSSSMLRCALQRRRPDDVQQRVWAPDILMSHWVTVLQCFQCPFQCLPWFPFLKCCVTLQVFSNVWGSGTWVQLLCSEEKHIMRSKAKEQSSGVLCLHSFNLFLSSG